jgi:hypothetical protein
MHRKLTLFAVVFLVATFVFGILTQTVKAQSGSSFQFIDRSLIAGYNGDGAIVARYYDNNVDGDNTYKFKDSNGCVIVITNEGSGGHPDTGGTNYLWLNPFDAHEGGCLFDFTMDMGSGEVYATVCKRLDLSGQPCSDGDKRARDLATKEGAVRTVSVGNTQKAKINYYIVDDTYIYRSDNGERYKRDGTSNKYYRTDDPDSCQDVITVKGGVGTDSPGGTLARMEEQGNGSCAEKKTELVYFGNVKARASDGPDGIPQTAAAAKADAKDGDSAPSCESEGGALGWIMCPVTRLIDDALNWVDTQIQALLEIDSTAYNNNDLHNAWAQIRNIAYIILVPIMLVMVIGTALGFSFIDAYTVRRALPRMVIAIVFIALSWEITTFLIYISNVIGGGVMGLLTAPFRHSPPIPELTLSSLYGGSIIQGALLLPLAGAAIIALWLFGGTLLLFAIIGFLVLLLRQLFVVALMLAAPLAILAWIFPGNDKLWKSWWSIFSKLLMMFPLIMGLIAVGRIFAIIIHDNGAGGAGLQGGILQPLSILIVWMLPYAFIPLTFRFAGGFFATITGMVNDRSKGLFDRAKQGRAAKTERTMGGAAFRSNTRLGRALNRPLQTGFMAATGRGGINPMNMRSRINSARGTAVSSEMAELMDKNQAIKDVAVDDHLAEATQLAQGRAQIREMLRNSRNRDGSASRWATAQPQELEEAVNLVERAQRAGSTTAVRSAMAVARANSGTGYGTSSDMYESIIQAAGGDRRLEGSLLAATRSGSERARRPDLASVGHVEQARYLDQVRATMGGDAAEHEATRGRVNATMRARSFETSGVHAALSGRTEAVGNMLDEMGADYDHAIQTGDVEMATEVASQIASVRQGMGSATPDVRRRIMAMLDHVGIDPGSSANVDQQLGAQIGQVAYGGGGTAQAARLAQEAAQQIRTRAGAYELGRGGLAPEQIQAGLQEPPQPPGH